MNAEIVSIGTELLLGEIVDTNSNHIARTLRDIGVNLYYMTAVGDNLQRITDVLKLGLARSDLIITTGGLGPTVDDVTRQAVAAATGCPLEFRQDLYEQIAAYFGRFGARMSENNRQQAFVPQGAIALENPVGTAPSFIVETAQGTVISLPGVPREMKYTLSQRVVPYLQEKMGAPKIIKALVLKTAGIGESHIDEQIADLMTYSNPTVGLAAHSGQTDIRITARADTHAEADAMIQEMEAKIRERVGGFIYGTGNTPLENAVVAILQRLHYTIAISETGTGGILRERIESVEGGRAILALAKQYPNLAALCADLNGGGTEDDISAAVEVAARELLQASAAKIAIAIATQPGGTAIAVTTPETSRKRLYGYGGDETQGPIWAAMWGMSIAWRLLREMEV
jgi:nicotinamide-nucleotide amidase